MKRYLTVGIAHEWVWQEWQLGLYILVDNIQAYMQAYGVSEWPELQDTQEYPGGWRLTFAWPDGIGRHDGH